MEYFHSRKLFQLDKWTFAVYSLKDKDDLPGVAGEKRQSMENKYFLGVDIGSTTIKAVLLAGDGTVKHSTYQRTRPVESAKLTCSGHCSNCGHCNLGSLKAIVDEFLSEAGVTREDILFTGVTGSQIVEDLDRFIPYDFHVSEVSAHVAGALHFYPDCKAILDVGGQDSKAMLYNESMQMWVSKMSGICAAGTGAFLDSVALKLGIPVEEMAEKVNYDSRLEFSSVCAVLSATSINKFKNRYPIGEIIAGACRAPARTIISGVGEILFSYKGDILFQGGVASNKAVAYYLKEISGNNIVIPEYHKVMGALGAACLARKNYELKDRLEEKKTFYPDIPLKSVTMRASSTRREFLGRSDGRPVVWRNLFFPTEILNAFDTRILTLETYAALFARNAKRVRKALDVAAYKGFSAETCSFLRVLEGVELPKADFAVSTSQPCQQGERIFQDLARENNFMENFFSLQTPVRIESEHTIEVVADGLKAAVARMEKAFGRKLDEGRLAEACHLSNEAASISKKCNRLRWASPPLLRGAEAVYNAVLFSQLWGKQELVDIQKQFYEDLLARREVLEKLGLDKQETHRILWLHLPPFYDTKLLDFIELACNAPIVFEEVNFVDWAELDPDDPYRSLARKLLTVGYLDPKLRVEYIRQNATESRLNGCILYNHGFGRCSLADSCFSKHLQEELKMINLPLLRLDGDCMDQTTDPCSTFTKVSAFVESLNRKMYGNIFGPLKA